MLQSKEVDLNQSPTVALKGKAKLPLTWSYLARLPKVMRGGNAYPTKGPYGSDVTANHIG